MSIVPHDSVCYYKKRGRRPFTQSGQTDRPKRFAIIQFISMGHSNSSFRRELDSLDFTDPQIMRVLFGTMLLRRRIKPLLTRASFSYFEGHARLWYIKDMTYIT